MKSLILASASPQRKKILKLTSLDFKIIPSQAQEATQLTKGAAHLVKHNALIKAQDIAKRHPHAIVIGSDTVVISFKKRLILKPKDLAEARKNLKELMQKPHWVYSGIAVIDTASGRTIVDYERTKVYMNELSDTSIKRYHALVSPLDKAGGFDIEGRGAMFIPRIEGCFYNVVGLPLAKLVEILKKFGIDAL